MSSKKPCQSNSANAKSRPRGLASKAKIRDRIGMAQRWYIQGIIPTDGDRNEVKQPSLDAVAQAADLPLVTIQRRSRVEGWVDQRETFARLALEVENKRLVRTIADQHARSRVAYFRSSMRIQFAVERKLAQDGEALDMLALSAAGSALVKAQKVTDASFIGPSMAMGGPTQDFVRPGVIIDLIHNGPSPGLQAMLAKMDEEEWAKGPTPPRCGYYTPS